MSSVKPTTSSKVQSKKRSREKAADGGKTPAPKRSKKVTTSSLKSRGGGGGGKKSEQYTAEMEPFVARDGAKKGDVLVGTSKSNFELAIKMAEDVKALPRRGHLIRCIDMALDDKQPFSVWSKNAALHIDWPIDLAKQMNFSELYFVYIVKMILESDSSRKELGRRLLSYYESGIKYNEQEEQKAATEAFNLLGFSVKYAVQPLHSSFVDVRFHILEPGTGSKSSTFRQLMEEAVEGHEGYTFDDVSRRIQEDTGYNKSTFFLNYHNIRHPDDRLYEHEDEVGKLMRLEYQGRTGTGNFSMPMAVKRYAYYVLIVSDGKDGEPCVSCELMDATELETLLALHSIKKSHTRRWNFPSLPGLEFVMICTETVSYEKEEEEEESELTCMEVEPSIDNNSMKITAGMLKSLLQKQIRRGHSEHAVATAMKISKLPPIYHPQYRTITTGLTALLQRLVVIVIEDVGFCMDLSPVCWMAFIAAHDKEWSPSVSLWRFIKRHVYEVTARQCRQIFQEDMQNKYRPPQAGELDNLTDLLSIEGLSRKEKAFLVGIELRCREPGMLGDRKMMQCMAGAILKHNYRIEGDGLNHLPIGEEGGIPRYIFVQGFENNKWSDQIMFDSPYAMDFHAYPSVVDRIFEESAHVFCHYQKASQGASKSSRGKRKQNSVDLLRADMWDFSSSFNFRDPKSTEAPASQREIYWKSEVLPVFELCVRSRLRQLGYRAPQPLTN